MSAKDGTPICKEGLALIKEYEGYRATAYKDVVSVWTIGYGTTDPAYAFSGNKITRQEAEILLLSDVAEAAKIVDKAVTVPLNEKQRAALTSFVYNIGPGKAGVKDGLVELKRGGQSTLLKKLNDGDYEGAALQFGLWTKAGGKVLKGLVRRRTAEQELFLSGTIKADEKPLESNVEPSGAEPAKPIGTKGVQATVGVSVGAVLTEVAKQFEPLQQYGSFIQTIFVGLTIAGIIYGIYGARKGN